MKIILEDEDMSFIEKINKDLESREKLPLFINRKGNYSISFNVLDIAKANAFFYDFVMTPNSKKIKEIEELIGIRFTTLNYADMKIKKLKEILNDFMGELERERIL